LERFASSSFHCPVSLGRREGVRLGEQLQRLFGVAGSTARGEHSCPRKVGARSKELRAHPVVERGGLGEVGVGLVVTAEDGGEATKEVVDRSFGRSGVIGQTMGIRNESLEQLGVSGHAVCTRTGSLR